ncbi:hypothetical protein B4145_3099 [Bacillus subtilis]|uniref:Uncharacterized protein n=1 Tax=Bacillus subtilis subsp. subtilis TaxID=135461 RepID=A0ABD4A162_BACIU|nr:hypothetical protein B4067_3211 [Bacillus subtilis subsp. subtilis]KIN51791.1 hypothetical protein B4145_3099 [Bacillus subtilis]
MKEEQHGDNLCTPVYDDGFYFLDCSLYSRDNLQYQKGLMKAGAI